eukprot:scaffold88791_cov65-Phaeocystis_antarctica.AAC.3
MAFQQDDLHVVVDQPSGEVCAPLQGLARDVLRQVEEFRRNKVHLALRVKPREALCQRCHDPWVSHLLSCAVQGEVTLERVNIRALLVQQRLSVAEDGGVFIEHVLQPIGAIVRAADDHEVRLLLPLTLTRLASSLQLPVCLLVSMPLAVVELLTQLARRRGQRGRRCWRGCWRRVWCWRGCRRGRRRRCPKPHGGRRCR